MVWCKETYCKVCKVYQADMDDMCPKRDNVCKYCCMRCTLWEGCSFVGKRDSLKHTTNSQKDIPLTKAEIKKLPGETTKKRKGEA